MDAPPIVNLDRAAESDAPLLANLLELYVHDLSAAFPGIRIGADGRFGYPRLPLYWSEPDQRFPFLIRQGGQVAGFALATRGSPASEDPALFDAAEFFVLRGQRRAGVGFLAAHLLWDLFPGPWTVRVSEGNASAIPFWESTVAAYTGGPATHTLRPGKPNPWRVFQFESRSQGTARGP